jgi:hypothetical protein
MLEIWHCQFLVVVLFQIHPLERYRFATPRSLHSLDGTLLMLKHELQTVVCFNCLDQELLDLDNSFAHLRIGVKWLTLIVTNGDLVVEVIGGPNYELGDRLGLVQELSINRDAGLLSFQTLELNCCLGHFHVSVGLLKGFLQLDHIVFMILNVVHSLVDHFFVFLNNVALECALSKLLPAKNELLNVVLEFSVEEAT